MQRYNIGITVQFSSSQVTTNYKWTLIDSLEISKYNN